MLQSIHVTLAYFTVIGFAVRAVWAFSGSPMLQQKWVRILPHVIDTLLLLAGIGLVVTFSHPLTQPWLLAKFAALFAYIGFGVLTLRASTNGLRLLGVLGALLALAYLFAVAFARNPLPF